MSIKTYRQTASASTASPPPTLSYGEIACDKDGTIYVGNSDNSPVSRVSYAVSAGTANSATTATTATNATGVTGNIKGYGIADDASNHYAWFLNYSGTGNKDGAKKYYAAVVADRAANISMSYNGNLYISYS